MYKTSKHRVDKILDFSDFSGGLNYLVPGDMLSENECSVLDELMFDPSSGMLTTRPAFEKVADIENVTGAYFARDIALIIAGNKLYSIENDGTFAINEIEGANIQAVSTPIFTTWDDGVIITTGYDKIYFYKNGAVEEITPKDPKGVLIRPTHCFTRLGRAVIFRENFDTFYYSNVGELKWEYGELESHAKYIEVGYKDSGEIAAAVPLSRDIIIFKTDGIIYRLVGEYPDWAVMEIARNVFVLKNSAIQLLNSAIFLTREGLMSIDTVQSYGDMQVNKNISRKIDPILSSQLGLSTGIYYFPSVQGLFINANPSGANFLLSTANGAFTRWKLPFVIKNGGEFGKKMYFISDNAIFESSPADEENGEKLKSRIVTKTYLNRDKWLLKKTDIYIKPTERGKINVSFGAFSYDVEPLNQRIAFTDHMNAYLDDTPLVSAVWQHFKFQDVLSSERLNVEINIEGRGSARVEATTAIIGD